jgi:glc operon protein GlcG
VTDPHGELIAFARMDGAPLSSTRIASNKAYTAARERKPTQEIGDKVRHPDKGHDIAYYGDDRFVGWGGGIPIWKDGLVVGAIGVSGLSSREDNELAMLALDVIEAQSPP